MSGLSPAPKPPTVLSTQERWVCVSRGPSVLLNLIITSIFLKNQQPHSADSCSLTPRHFSSIIGCARNNPCFFLPEVGSSGWKCGGGLRAPVSEGCPFLTPVAGLLPWQLVGQTCTACVLLPPASLWFHFPNSEGTCGWEACWVVCPDFQGILGHTQGLRWAWAALRPHSAVLSFPVMPTVTVTVRRSRW